MAVKLNATSPKLVVGGQNPLERRLALAGQIIGNIDLATNFEARNYVSPFAPGAVDQLISEPTSDQLVDQAQPQDKDWENNAVPAVESNRPEILPSISSAFMKLMPKAKIESTTIPKNVFAATAEWITSISKGGALNEAPQLLNVGREAEQEDVADGTYGCEPLEFVEGDKQIHRSERGTIEIVVQETGHAIIPVYNRCGILKMVDLGETVVEHDSISKTWKWIDKTHEKLQGIFKAVKFDKQGNLLFTTFDDIDQRFTAKSGLVPVKVRR